MLISPNCEGLQFISLLYLHKPCKRGLELLSNRGRITLYTDIELVFPP